MLVNQVFAFDFERVPDARATQGAYVSLEQETISRSVAPTLL